jgi:SAM-dependent methyltransferase
MSQATDRRIVVDGLRWRWALSEVRRGGSLIRAGLNQAVREDVFVSGEVLDLGGGSKASYRPLLGGSAARITSIDAGARMGAELAMNLEDVPLPLPAASFDTVIAFNLIEHIFRHTELLQDSARLLRPGGTCYIWVPFLIGHHPDPHDYFRYTHEALVRLLEGAGFEQIRVRGFGGRFAAGLSVAGSAIPTRPLRMIATLLALVLDRMYYRVARAGSRKDCALGYLAIGVRPG